MARRRRGRGRRTKGIPVLSIAILAGQAALANSAGGSMLEKLDNFQKFYTGYDFTANQWQPYQLLTGWGPWIAKGVISKVARAVGARPRLIPGLSLS